MITDDEVMRVLEQANPASVDDPIPMLDIAGYRDVLDATHTTMTLFDIEPKPVEPSNGRRWTILLAAAAAVVAIALVATRNDDATPADQPSPTVTVPPTAPPRALLTAPEDPELLAPGTYFVDEVAGTPTPRIFVTVGAGWSTDGDGSSLGKNRRPPPRRPEDLVGFIMFSRPDKVYSDACHLSDGFYPGPVTTLDGLVTALVEQQGGWVDVTAPADISIDGYPGKTFQRTVPDVITDCPDATPGRMRDPELDGNALRSWLNENEEGFAGWYYEPGQVETLIVLDIDGTVIVINANLWVTASATDRAKYADVLDSIRIASSPDDATPADQPLPTVTLPPTAPPRALITAEQFPEQLVPGTYFADWFRGPETTMRILVTVGAGWTTTVWWNQQSLDLGLWKTGQGVDPWNYAGSLTFSHPGDDVFSDACHPSEGYTPADVATVDGLVNALTAQAGWAEVTAPVGHLRRRLRRQSIPTHRPHRHVGLRHRRAWWTQRWIVRGCTRTSEVGSGTSYEPGQTETAWVLDFDGTVVVITTTAFPETSEADRAELAAALDSVRIDRA